MSDGYHSGDFLRQVVQMLLKRLYLLKYALINIVCIFQKILVAMRISRLGILVKRY